MRKNKTVKSHMKHRFLGVIFLFLIMAVMAMPGPAGESLSHGQIDWLNGTIKTTGVAHPQSKDSDISVDPQKMLSVAKVSAQQNLLEMIKQLLVSSTARVDMLVGSDQLLMAKIQELIKNARVIKKAYLSDGTLLLTIEFRLWGAFTQLILPTEVKQIETITPIEPSVEEGKIKRDESRWTGLIVDARGVSLKPTFLPYIFDDLNGQVYGPEFINRDFAVQWGMCGYTSDMEAALKNDRTGQNPLVVKAIGTTGPEQTDIVISTADASLTWSASEHVRILREGRVVVVVE
jgi:hypothetical protein